MSDPNVVAETATSWATWLANNGTTLGTYFLMAIGALVTLLTLVSVYVHWGVKGIVLAVQNLVSDVQAHRKPELTSDDIDQIVAQCKGNKTS